MSTAELKTDLLKYIMETEDNSMLERLKNLVSSMKKSKTSDWYNDLTVDEKKNLGKSIKQADKGLTTPHEEVMKDMRNKFPHLNL